MLVATYATPAQLEAALPEIRQSPADAGTVALIVRRPAEDQREVLQEGVLALEEGLVGDNWSRRPSSRSKDGSPHPEMQLNVINARLIESLAGPQERWPLAGDQLYLDLDLSIDNLPAGTQLALGTAVIEVTPELHAGCKKFATRFGRDAVIFVNSPTGKALRLRGLNARVVQAGIVRQGDTVHKL